MKIALTVSFEAHLRKYLPFFYCSTVCTKKMAWGIEQCCRQFLEICHMVLLCSSCLSILQIVKTAELFLRGHEYLNRFLIPLRRFKFLSLGGTKKNSTTVWNRFKRHFKKLLDVDAYLKKTKCYFKQRFYHKVWARVCYVYF